MPSPGPSMPLPDQGFQLPLGSWGKGEEPPAAPTKAFPPVEVGAGPVIH